MTDSAASFSGRATQASIPSLPCQGIYGDRQHALEGQSRRLIKSGATLLSILNDHMRFAQNGRSPMPESFKRGDYVEWNSEAGKVRGVIIRKVASDIRLVSVVFGPSRRSVNN